MSSDVAAPSTTPTASRLAVLLFTDLVDSTAFKTRFGTVAFARLLGRHDAIFKQLIAPVPMAEILQDTGDGYFASFATTADALQFALRFQRALQEERWDPADAALRARIGIHMGEIAQLPPSEAGGKTKVVGMAADVAARVMSLGVGGQILLTRVAFDEARQFVREHPVVASAGDASASISLPPLKWMAHGEYLFKGASDPIEVFEVGGEGIAPLRPPPDSDKARRSVSASEEETLGWRPAVGLEVPQRVGWTLTRKLGEGTFGEVWLARSDTTKQTRVFKFCFDAERLRSFKREVTFFRLLRDVLGERDDIAQLYDVRLNEPPFFLESEFASGGNLLDWAASKGGVEKVPLETRIDLVARIADAVAAAHSVGILHKDIKPSNILVHEQNGTAMPQLADFGIGLLTDKTQLQSHHITEAGFTLLEGNESSRTGTRMYAPPESLAHKPFTIQGDVYALGVLLYQMVVGDLNRPLAEGWEREVGDAFLREDVAACVDGDAGKRLGSALDLSRRLRALPERTAQREREFEAAAAAERHKHLLRVARLAAAGCALVAVVSAAAYFREHALYRAVTISELLARQSERASQYKLLENLLLSGESLAQSRRYAEALNSYDQAWTLASSLSEPTLAAVSGLLQVANESPPPLINRRVVTSPNDPGSPLVCGRLSPDGRTYVAGDAAEHVHVMELPTARVTAVLPVAGWGSGIAFSPDGALCVIGGSRRGLAVWRAARWDQPAESLSDAPPARAVAMTAAGREFVTIEPARPGRSPGSIHFWSLRPLRHLREVACATAPLCAAFSPDDKLLAVGDSGGTVTLYEPADVSKPVATLAGHTGDVNAVAFTPDGVRLVSASADKTARVWDLAARKEVLRLDGERGTFMDISVSHDGRLIAGGGSDETVKLWDAATGGRVMTFSRHPRGVSSVSFVPDDSALISCGRNGRVAAWNILGGDDSASWKRNRGAAAGLCICPDGRTALTCGSDRQVRQIDLATGQIVRSASFPQGASDIAVLPDGARAIVCGAGGMLLSLDVKEFKPEPIDLSSLPPSRPFHSAATTVSTATPTTPQPTTRPVRFERGLGALAVSPTGNRLLVGGDDNIFAVASLPPGGRGSGGGAGYARRCAGPIRAACFSPDGGKALVAVDRDLFLIDAATGQIEREILKQSTQVTSVAIAQQGRVAASASYDDFIRMWDLQTGMSTKALVGHLGRVRAIAFLPDGKSLVSGGEDDTVRLWDTATRRELRCFTGHTAPITALAVSVDGTMILSADEAGAVHKWDLSRPAQDRAMQLPLNGLPPRIDNPPAGDPAAIAKLGEWYALRGRDDWAAECLERGRAAGVAVSPLMLARCYWKLHRYDAAAREFGAALAAKEAPADYLELCLATVSAGAKGAE